MITAQEFVAHMESALSRFYKETLKASTVMWHKRNSGDTISGSGFAKCLRLCYYRWFDKDREHKDPAFGDKLDIKSQRNMFHGLMVEDWVIGALKQFGLPGGSLVHKEQDAPPVVLTDTVTENGVEITRSAANDMVVECMGGKDRYFIPFECKTTDRTFTSRRPGSAKEWVNPDKWWLEFCGYDEHKRQLMQWIWLARKNNMVVPFGILFYQRRGTLETKYIVIAVDAVNLDRFNGASEIVDYMMYEERMDIRNLEMVNALGYKVLPPYDPTISSKLCDSCVYKKQCESER